MWIRCSDDGYMHPAYMVDVRDGHNGDPICCECHDKTQAPKANGRG